MTAASHRQPKTVGVLGSMVWDRIEYPGEPVVERWGGISYSIAAAVAAAPDAWTIRPIIKIGHDLEEAARDFLADLPRLDLDTGLARTDRPNNRVHLRYQDRDRRHEHLTGGVPAWSWDELEPRLEGLEGLYVNLISGFELDLDTTRRLRGAVQGLLYADLHSLLLGMADDGARPPRPLENREAWLGSFDCVQVNEDELGLVAHGEDGLEIAAQAVRDGLDAFLITRGPAGATWIARGDQHDGDDVVAHDAPLETDATGIDPTGCGDVWGATCFIELAQGTPLPRAVRQANGAAARNAGHRGADGLYQQLKVEA